MLQLLCWLCSWDSSGQVMVPPEVTVLMAWALCLPKPARGLGSINYSLEESHRCQNPLLPLDRGCSSCLPSQGHQRSAVDPGATKCELSGLTYRRIFQ